MSTIREVALRSGFSTATVSHVVNGKLDKVSAVTRERVLAAIRELRYRPPAMEVSQRTLSSHNIGLLVPDLGKESIRQNEYMAAILDGATDYCLHNGWSITFMAKRVWDDAGRAIRRSYDGRCDGVILSAPVIGSDLVDALAERGVPLVLISTTAWCPGVSSVDVDNRAIGQEAARRIWEGGHRRFAYLGRNSNVSSSSERERAFRGTLLELGAAPDDIRSYDERLNEDAIVRLHVDALRGWRPTACFCWNDGLARHLVRHLNAQGMNVPNDCSVLGVDDFAESVEAEPLLSTFHQPLVEIGRRAAEILIQRIHDPSSKDEIVRLPAPFVDRGSLIEHRNPSS